MIAVAQHPNTGLPIDEVLHGDALLVLRSLPTNSVDAIVCDPPSAINFMGKSWDSDKGGRSQWVAWLSSIMQEALRVLKPGGYGLIWSLPRTSHWTALALEDAGFLVKDVITSIFGSGFPKSMDISKAIDKMNGNALAWKQFSSAYAEAIKKSPYSHSDIDKMLSIKSSSCYWARLDHRGGMPPRQHWEKVQQLLNLPTEFERLYDEAEREVLATRHDKGNRPISIIQGGKDYTITAPATPEAQQWSGFGSALKPSTEFWWLVQKPISEKSIAANVLKHGVGALNIDGCRVDGASGNGHWTHKREIGNGTIYHGGGREEVDFGRNNPAGKRFPSHLLLSHSLFCTEDFCDSSCPIRILNEQSGIRKSGDGDKHGRKPSMFMSSTDWEQFRGTSIGGDTGGASRYFQTFHYFSKSSRRERNSGCEGLPEHKRNATAFDGAGGLQNRIGEDGKITPKAIPAPEANTHPTVKSLSLMSWLCRLITPPGGLILDPFLGSGSTAVAAIHEGFHFIGIEAEEDYVNICNARIAHAWEVPV